MNELTVLLDTLHRMADIEVGILDNDGCHDELAAVCRERSWQYVVPGRNIGFGAGHNLIHQTITPRTYHLLLNPDVTFSAQDLAKILTYMDTHPDIGCMMPDVRYPEGARQHLCKLLPTPMDLIARRFLPRSAWKSAMQARYELRAWAHDEIQDIPSLSGCFMLLRSEAFRAVGGFDERFFLYLEDFDLVRRIGSRWRTVFYPGVQVIHGHAKGSYRSRRLLALHMRSAIKYFNKWGWFFDAERKRRNADCMKRLDLLR